MMIEMTDEERSKYLSEYQLRWREVRRTIEGGIGLTEEETAELRKLQDRSSCPMVSGGMYGTKKYPHRDDCSCGGPLTLEEKVRKTALLYKRGG
jgi:hypothetical protein